MSKPTTTFNCQNCGYSSSKWLGKCPDCNQWNTFSEEVKTSQKIASRYQTEHLAGGGLPPIPLDQIREQKLDRFSSGNLELDRLLGGGIVPGSLTLLGGEPGIGKSTLVLQLLGHLSKTDPVLYVSGEESASQIQMRAERLGIQSSRLMVYSENNLQRVLEVMDSIQPKLMVLDSIQTLYFPEFESAPGSLTQVRECAAKILQTTKTKSMATWLIGHVTKEGMIAGPKVLEHLVDTVLYFEGDQGLAYRLLRTTKNRFGSTNEVGVFEMKPEGLVAVTNPSSIFLSDAAEQSSGSAVVTTLEGTRPLLVELQALVVGSYLAMPRRVCSGFDPNRLALLMAILEKTAGFSFAGQDVFVNVAGGFRLSEPSVDLGILMALASSQKNSLLPSKTVFIGEVGLGGEIRPVAQTELRLAEVKRLGFEKAVVASKVAKTHQKQGLEVIGVRTLKEVFSQIKMK